MIRLGAHWPVHLGLFPDTGMGSCCARLGVFGRRLSLLIVILSGVVVLASWDVIWRFVCHLVFYRAYKSIVSEEIIMVGAVPGEHGRVACDYVGAAFFGGFARETWFGVSGVERPFIAYRLPGERGFL